MKKLLSFLAMALCFVACQNELTMGVSNADLVDVVLNLEAPELVVTRLDGDEQKGGDSAYGGIDFMGDANWDAYDIRYILEVYSKDAQGVDQLVGKRMVNCLDKYAPTSFELRLVPNREYKFVVFADFVAEGNAEAEDKLAIADLFYTTADLSNIACKTLTPSWTPMNEVRDAYFISKTLKVETGLNETLTLTRPFGKLRVITTDIEQVTGYATPARVEIAYTDGVYKSFNAITGALNDDMMSGDELKYNYNIGKTIPYYLGYDALTTHQTLFADYLLGKEGEQIPVNFTMSVYDNGNRLIHSKDFNTQIPIQRNWLTTIIGDLLTTQANVNIEINDDFSGEYVNETMTPALATPKAVSEPKVEGNVITIEWEAVENAANYSVTVNNEMPVFVEETTYTFTGEYETKYTFLVAAIPADEDKYTHSAAKVFTAETGEAPVVETYKLYLNNEEAWTKVNVYAWDDTATLFGDWPGTEVTEKETIEGVEYYAYTVPAELNGKTINVIFNNGVDKQTKDITGVEITKDNFFTNYVEPAQPSDLILYLKPNANWKVDDARFAAYFFGAGKVWYDMTLVEGETDIYSVVAPAGYPNVIFCRMNPSSTDNNWNNKWNQTADLKVPADEATLYTVKENTWDNGGGAWSVYTPAVVEPEQPVALATPVVTANVDVNVVTLTWEAIDGAAKYEVVVDDDVPAEVTEPKYVFEGDYEVTYTFTVKAIAADAEKNLDSEAAVVEVTTEAKPADEPTYTTVAEFIAAAEDTTTMYTLKGTITAVANSSYGNFDLTDDTGTVYIYGLNSPDGTISKYWATSGAKIGDDIVVKTIRTSFNNAPQGKNAWFVELLPGTRAFYNVDATIVEFPYTGGEQVVKVNAYNTDAAVTAVSQSDKFTATVDGYNVTIATVAENELEEKVSGVVVVKVGDLAETEIKVTIGAKPAEGEALGGSDDFDTISSTNTSYVSGKTKAGWSYASCAIFQGGTSDQSPKFKMIGDASNRALCMNGKTSAVGTITSPTFTTGCGTLKFNYGLPFSDTKIKFRVDILQDGEVVKTFTVNPTSVTKLTKYSHEEVINVDGEFQIKFTNLSPSNNTSNKDRTAIWDVEWNGYTE